ncbi:hypothetical protein F2Q69_00031380 [Brassica cretica]|uniref:Uncharacterized protein n=1 Tax=Brassica cretica TaxID=69181 RepID=A0A8S9S483_BRACR|nr:hypothetical protein F2Q69_00031380 [Brassica cretica]
MMFLQHELFHETSAEYYFKDTGSRTGIKQDGKQARRDRSMTEKPEIGRNLNFGIMEVFDEAEGSGIIYRQVMQPDIWEEWWWPVCVMAMLIAMWSTRTVSSFDDQVEVLFRVSSVPRVQIGRSSARCSAGKSKNCPEAKGGSVKVQISLSRPVSFFMVKPRFCPSQDQSSPVQSSRPWGHIGRNTGTIGYSCRVECLVRIWNFSLRVVDIKAMRFPLLEARSWQEAKSNLVMVALGKDDRIAWC